VEFATAGLAALQKLWMDDAGAVRSRLGVGDINLALRSAKKRTPTSARTLQPRTVLRM